MAGQRKADRGVFFIDGSWGYRINAGTDPVTGKRRQPSRKGFRTKKEAEQARREALAARDGGTLVDRSAKSVAHYLQSWLEVQQTRVKPSTLRSYKHGVARIESVLGTVALQALTAFQVEAFYAGLLARGLSRKTVRNTHTPLRKALADAERLGLVVRNVAAAARPPSAERPEFLVWTPEQLREFLGSISSDRLAPVFVVLAATGLRRGEALGLRWKDLDLSRNQLAVVQSITSVGGQLVTTTPKTARSRRNVAIDKSTAHVLRQWKVRQNEERLAAGPAWEGDGTLVFTDPFGRPTHPDALSRAFRRMVSDCDVPKIRLHDIRHTHATLALQQGVHPKVVSERLGHSTVAITLDIYSHVTPALSRDAADAVAALIFD